MSPGEIRKERGEAARKVEAGFGTQNALDCLIGEKFPGSLEAADSLADFCAEIPAFVAKVKRIFEPWQLAGSLKTARQTEPFIRTFTWTKTQ
jgi:hypothetical protein